MEYRTNFQSVTEHRPEGLDGYATVYTTWQISLQAIKAQNTEAAQLLLLYGFLSNNVSDEIILHGEERQTAGVNDAAQLKVSIRLLLSYSLVKRDGIRHTVWIHPVVHTWTCQHLTLAEKVQQTEHAVSVVAKCIEWNSQGHSLENKLAFSTLMLPDVEACMKNIIVKTRLTLTDFPATPSPVGFPEFRSFV